MKIAGISLFALLCLSIPSCSIWLAYENGKDVMVVVWMWVIAVGFIGALLLSVWMMTRN